MSEAAPAPQRCPRCGGPVGCGFASAGPCWCTTVRLDDGLRADLAARYQGCLCRDCLGALIQDRPTASPTPSP